MAEPRPMSYGSPSRSNAPIMSCVQPDEAAEKGVKPYSAPTARPCRRETISPRATWTTGCRDGIFHPGTPAGAERLRRRHEEVVPRDVLVEVDSASVHLDALARARRRLAARIVDLAVHFVQAVTCLARRGCGVNGEDRPPPAEIGRKRDPAVRRRHLAAAGELERDQPSKREAPVLDFGRAGHDGERAVAARRLPGHVEGALE